MTNQLADTLKSINNAANNNLLATNSLNHFRNFLLTLAEIDHRLDESKMD